MTARAASLAWTTPATGSKTLSYDAQNRVTSVNTPQGTLTHTYDVATGRVTETSTQYTDTRYTYDPLGRLSTATVDEANGVALASPLVTTYTYTPTGNIASAIQANGVVTDNTYDARNRLIGIKDTNASGQLLDEYLYTLDPAGRRIADDEFQLQGDGTLDEVIVTWTYDALGRLLTEDSVDVTGSRPSLTYDTAYTYDLDGNLVATTTVNASGTVTVSDTYNADGELVNSTSSSGTTATYAYDANGSLISQETNGQPAAAYAYDLQNRLVTATVYTTNAGGQLVATSSAYTYDFGGNLVGEQTSVSVAGVYQGSTQQFFLNDAMNPTDYTQVLEVRDSSGTPQLTYVIGDRVLAQIVRSGTVQVLSSDALGSTRTITDASGQITDRFDYTAYGVPLDFNASQASTAVLFAGQSFDAAIGASTCAPDSTTRPRTSSSLATPRRGTSNCPSRSTPTRTRMMARRMAPTRAATGSTGRKSARRFIMLSVRTSGKSSRKSTHKVGRGHRPMRTSPTSCSWWKRSGRTSWPWCPWWDSSPRSPITWA